MKKALVLVGVLQGDTLAPYLFILVVDALLADLPPGIGLSIGPTELSPDQAFLLRESAYADDIMLLAHTRDDLAALFGHLERTALHWQLDSV